MDDVLFESTIHLSLKRIGLGSHQQDQLSFTG